LRLDFVADGHGSDAYGPIIQKKEVRRPPSRQFGNWFISAHQDSQ